MITSTPMRKPLTRSHLHLEEIPPAFTARRSIDEALNRLERSEIQIERISPSSWEPPKYSRSNLTNDMSRSTSIIRDIDDSFTSSRESLSDIERQRYLSRSNISLKDVFLDTPRIREQKAPEKRTFGTSPAVSMRDLKSNEEVSKIVDEALRAYQTSLNKQVANKEVDCRLLLDSKKPQKDQQVQVSECLKMRSSVGTMAKPKTVEVAVEAKVETKCRTIGVGPETLDQKSLSLNSLNSRSHSFNYGDNKRRLAKATRNIAVSADDLFKMTDKATNTINVKPLTREFGTSPPKKKFVDVSVGDSVKPHVAISCSPNYCDNCKEAIKSLSKQIIADATEYNNMNQQNTSPVSKIPRPTNIPLYTTSELKKQFKRQDTYTKIPASGVVRYDADNKDEYNRNNR